MRRSFRRIPHDRAAFDGEEGLQRALELRPDLIVTDIAMPRMSGDRLVHEIRTHAELEYVPIVVLTSTGDGELRAALLESGAQDYVMKPFSAKELLARVNNLVVLKRVGDLLRHELETRSDDIELLAADLATSQRRVDAQNRDLEAMLNVAAHDLQEPLRAIGMFSTRLDSDYGAILDERGRDFLRRMSRAAARMRHLLDGLQQVARARDIAVGQCDFRGLEIVEEALDRLNDRIRECGAAVRVEGTFPTVCAERSWAVEALANLIANALKFTQPDTSPDIEIAAYDESDGVGFVVRDRGPGIVPEMRVRIFELFERGVGHSVEGTGAGLAIVRQVAERHGGKAWVRSRAGGGSEFIVMFGPPGATRH